MPMKRKTRVRSAVAIVAVMVLAVALWRLAGFPVLKDSFRPDTGAGRLQLDAQVRDHRHRGIVLATQMGSLGGEPVGFQVLTGILPVGSEVRIGASVPRTGTFSEGGGWVFSGRRYYGTHAVTAYIVAAESSRPDVLDAKLLPLGRVRLIALTTGESVLRLTARKRRHGTAAPESLPVEDSIAFRVIH